MGKSNINLKLKVKDYSNLKKDNREAVDYVISYGLKDNKVLRLKRKQIKPKYNSLFDLQWQQIIDLKNFVIQNNILAVLSMLYGINEKQFVNLNLFNCFAVYQTVLKEVENLLELEKNELYSEPTSKEKRAGIDRLSNFEHFPVLDALADGDPTKYDQILKLPYSVIFTKQALNKTKNEIQTNYYNIKD